jgi:signal peptidase I
MKQTTEQPYIRHAQREEMEREKHRQRQKEKTTRRSFWTALKSTISTLIVVAAVVVLISNLVFPVLRIYGTSMSSTLNEGDIVVSVKGSNFRTGDIIAFYYNNKLLIKRVIGNAGDWIDIDKDGNVYVNNELIDEPYLKEKAFGECNITLPYQVPESRIFVMGDNRSVSVDSRNTAVGCVAEEQIAGRLILRVWPLQRIRLLL